MATKWTIIKGGSTIYEKTSDSAEYEFPKNLGEKKQTFNISAQYDNCTESETITINPCQISVEYISMECVPIGNKDETLFVKCRITEARTEDITLYASLKAENFTYTTPSEHITLKAGETEFTLEFKKYWPYDVFAANGSSEWTTFHGTIRISSSLEVANNTVKLEMDSNSIPHCVIPECTIAVRIKSPSQECNQAVYAQNYLFFSFDDLSIGTSTETSGCLNAAVQKDLGRNDFVTNLHFKANDNSFSNYFIDFGSYNNRPFVGTSFTLYAYTLGSDKKIATKSSATFQTQSTNNYTYNATVNWDTCTNGLSLTKD